LISFSSVLTLVFQIEISVVIEDVADLDVAAFVEFFILEVHVEVDDKQVEAHKDEQDAAQVLALVEVLLEVVVLRDGVVDADLVFGQVLVELGEVKLVGVAHPEFTVALELLGDLLAQMQLLLQILLLLELPYEVVDLHRLGPLLGNYLQELQHVDQRVLQSEHIVRHSLHQDILHLLQHFRLDVAQCHYLV